MAFFATSVIVLAYTCGTLCLATNAIQVCTQVQLASTCVSVWPELNDEFSFLGMLHESWRDDFLLDKVSVKKIVMYQTRDSVSSDFQTLRRELKIRRAEEYLTKFEVFG